ncbi:MAG: hypothetical protein H5T59_07160 [Anaerolineae bacterium]|nr:hypothetical protein [Anaerolineae bacterium]
MLRSFGVRQLPVVYRLWGRGLSIDMQAGLPGGAVPFWPALVAMLPGLSPLGETLFVLEDEGAEAFIQVRHRPERPEADLVYIAPALRRAPEAAEAWDALLTGTCLALGRQGVERVYACLPESGPEVESFQKAGFILYTREEIYRLDGDAEGAPGPADVPLRARAPEHDWGLDRLYSELVPWLVQQAEGGLGFNGFGSGVARPAGAAEYVLLEGGEVAGLVQLRPVSGAYGMTVVLHPRAYHWARAVVAFGLGRLRSLPPRPVYCTVRHYQGGLRTPLEESGFRWVGTRALLVRHTVARARAAQERRAEGKETQPEAAIPTALGFSGADLAHPPGPFPLRKTEGGAAPGGAG